MNFTAHFAGIEVTTANKHGNPRFYYVMKSVCNRFITGKNIADGIFKSIIASVL